MMKAGIVGCGNIARVHADVLKNMENVSLLAVADTNEKQAEVFAQDYGQQNTAWYPCLETMIEQEELDVLHICTPHHLHVPMAVYALEHGLHVFMEKPPAITRKEFMILKQKEADTKKRIGVCFQNRYNETVCKMKEVLEKGTIGAPVGARAFVTWNRGREYYQSSGWRGTWKKEGGGVLINQSIHTLDLLVWLLGKPLQAEASFVNHHLKQVIEVEDTLEGFIQFQNADVCFYATNAYADDSPVFLEIICEHGKLRMEGGTLWIWYEEGRSVKYNLSQAVHIGKQYWGNSHPACIGDFYRSIDTGVSFKNSLASAEDTFALAMDLYESGKNHSAVICGKGYR